MPRILRILNRFNVGGPTYNATYLTKYLSEEFETRLIGGQKDPSEASSLYMARALGVEPEVIPEMRRSLNPLRDYKTYRKIKEIIREFKPDIVHTHASKAGAIGRLAAMSCNTPVIVHTFHGHVFHSYFNPIVAGVYKVIEKYLAKKSSAIIAISQIQKNELVNEHKISTEEKVRVIPLGFDLEKFAQNTAEKRSNFRQQYEIENEALVVGIIGRLVPIKNHQLFIKAANYIFKNTKKRICFVIIGDGESRIEIEDHCASAGLSFGTKDSNKHQVIFTSWIKEIDWALAGLDIVCLTSLNEGTPVSLIEAQAAEKPIVSTEVGGIKNVVAPDTSALLSPIENEQLFCENLLKVVENESLREQLASAGKDMVLEQFSYHRLVKQTEELYHELLNR